MNLSGLPSFASLTFVGAVCFSGCSRPGLVPPPEDAARAYAAALERGDASALRLMMTESARSEYTESELKALLKRDAEEFAERARELKGDLPDPQGAAQVYLRDGRIVDLELDTGRFWVRSAGLVARQPRSPEEAVQLLRDAVSARDYEKIAATLTPESQRDFARAFERLDESLEELQSAVVDVREDRATIEFLDGREILLRRIEGVWRVEEFE